MSKLSDDDDGLCADGEALWANHLKKVVDSNGLTMSGYERYLKHIWSCKECQKGLELTPKIIEMQREWHYGKGRI